jgi:hypothetical protein
MFLRGRTVRAIAVATMAAAVSGAGMTTAWADNASPSSCSGTAVQISNVDFKVVGPDVVVTFSHTSTGCPATLHVHENLVASPKAGSDPNHQLNQNFSIGPDGPTSVSVPLLAPADNKCFVQVDVHYNTDQSTGGFVPTATCPSTSPTPTPSTSPTPTPAPSTSPTATPSTSPTASTSPTPTTTASTSAAPAAVVTPSPSQSALPPVTIETGQQPAASRWPMSSVVVGAIAVSLILAGGLVLLVRRWGHASPK